MGLFKIFVKGIYNMGSCYLFIVQADKKIPVIFYGIGPLVASK